MMNSIAIVGAGLSGISAARVLRDEGYDGRLWILGEEVHRPYDRPSLSKSVLSGDEQVPPELVETKWYGDNDVELVSSTKVSAFDPRGRKLELENGSSIGIDGVLLATGARARRLDVPGSELDGVHYLRTLDDSLAIRGSLKPGVSLVIIGGGLIGCEVASTARKLGAEVTILETADELLLRVMGSTAGALCHRLLEAMGVHVLLGAKAARFVGAGRVEAVMTQANECIPADIVLVSVGAEPDIALAAAAGIVCERGIVVDGSGRTSMPGVFAAGDAAAWPLKAGGRRSFETYLNSQAQSAAAARAMLGRGTPECQVPLSWTEIAGRRMQMIGDLAGPGAVVVRGDPSAGSHTFFRIDGDRVVAAVSVDAARDFVTARRLVEMATTVKIAVLCDVNNDLRGLTRATTGA